MLCIQTLRSFLHARYVNIRPTAGGIKSFVRVLPMLADMRPAALSLIAFAVTECNQASESFAFLILRLKNRQRLASLPPQVADTSGEPTPAPPAA